MRLFRRSAGGNLVVVKSADLENNPLENKKLVWVETKRQENSTAAVEPEIKIPEPVELPIPTSTDAPIVAEPVTPTPVDEAPSSTSESIEPPVATSEPTSSIADPVEPSPVPAASSPDPIILSSEPVVEPTSLPVAIEAIPPTETSAAPSVTPTETLPESAAPAETSVETPTTTSEIPVPQTTSAPLPDANSGTESSIVSAEATSAPEVQSSALPTDQSAAAPITTSASSATDKSSVTTDIPSITSSSSDASKTDSVAVPDGLKTSLDSEATIKGPSNTASSAGALVTDKASLKEADLASDFGLLISGGKSLSSALSSVFLGGKAISSTTLTGSSKSSQTVSVRTSTLTDGRITRVTSTIAKSTSIPGFSAGAAQAQSAVDPQETANPTATNGGRLNGNGGTDLSPTATGTNNGAGGLNVTKVNQAETSTTIAIAVAVIAAGVIAISVGAYFLIRRYMRNRTAHADSPPPSPIISKFEPGHISSARQPELDQEKWNSQTQDIDWNRSRGNDGLDLEWPLSPASYARREKDMERGSGLREMERNASVRSGGMRETMTIFPAGREKLGGVQMPQRF